MSKIVAGLEVSGLLTRRIDPEDGRAVRLEATKRGAKLLHDGRRRRVARLAEALETLEPQDVEILNRAAAIIERIAPTI